MPLVILTGIPGSGKTTRAEQLKQYLEENKKKVIVISEYEAIIKAGYVKDTYYLDSQKEKQVRGFLKSEVIRYIGTDVVVILDGTNYIKGYRYELYCASKANKSTQCTIHCEINVNKALEFNENRSNKCETYSKQTFDALVMRYESPDSRNRWDQPLFVILPDDTLDFKSISDCLFDKKPPPPNMSTQNPPLSSTNFLYELDKITQNITKSILSAKQLGLAGEIKIPNYPNLSIDSDKINAPQLSRLRRQFLTYTKMHPTDIDKIDSLYVQYLNTSLNG